MKKIYGRVGAGFCEVAEAGVVPGDDLIEMREVRPTDQHIAARADSGDEDRRGRWVLPVRSIQELAVTAMTEVNAEYINRMSALASPYPLHERESWPIQLAEAQTVLVYPGGELPDGVTSPWIDQCAHQRGLSRLELAQRIVAKDTAYRTVSGFLSGVRQWHEDCIDLLLQKGEESRYALQAYDHMQRWARS